MGLHNSYADAGASVLLDGAHTHTYTYPHVDRERDRDKKILKIAATASNLCMMVLKGERALTFKLSSYGTILICSFFEPFIIFG